ncbi:hypothetical protein RD792_017366 [Penstemon davidsonii]|uniref:Bifunctional inhibitor/plant lipid transfer protein/seed storage helical domain-containing protein n=1 Tax=Penstemon davidsonii TaxID=160366 RepID=A0ABR0CNQ0_9LAMI|nr:hypothetical protein RD792_017366 [Penstemon davidsonii]
MAPKWIGIGSVVFVVAILSTGAMAQSGCTSVLISMASCLNYIQGSDSTPPTSCCTSLANVVQNQPQCLCTIVNGGGGSLGVSINQTRALGLPTTCNVKTPPVSRCNAANGPAMSPVGSPANSPYGSPTSPTSPSVSGNSSTPSNSCCNQLGTVVRSQPQCLCQVINGGGSNLGLNINQTQALALPTSCNVRTAPVSRCNAASPSGSPTPSSPNTNQGGGSKTIPSTGDGTSDATSDILAVPVLLFLVFLASYVSNMV